MVSIIGAGPAGSFYAYRQQQEKEKGNKTLLDQNEDVHLFEEHKVVGKPVACTGIITEAVNQFIKPPKELIVNKIKQFKIIAPNGEASYINLKKTNTIFDRAGFDQFLFQKAVDQGVTTHLGETFEGFKESTSDNFKYKVKTNKGTYETNQLVGADGPYSSVAKSANLYGKREFVKGWQARCKYPDLEKGVTIVHLNCGEFSWIVPENEEVARVGVIGRDTTKLKADYKRLVGDNKIIEDQSGTIPLYNPKQKIRKDNVFLLGDAATHVKATTYGGILYGMIAGDHLATNQNKFVSNVDKKLSKDLWVSLKMREYMNKMSEKQADDLIDIFKKKENADILASHDRNFPSTFLVQLLMKETKLWKLGFDLFRK